MNLFVLISAVVAAIGAAPMDIPKAGIKAASPYINYGCQCDSLTFLDKYGTIQGNCESIDETGARWCYLPLHGYNTCTDVGYGQTSSRFPGRQWSYEACATPPPPANPQPPVHPGQGGCLITKDGTGCEDKFENGSPVYGVYGYGHIPTIETIINGATGNGAIDTGISGSENNNNVEDESNNNVSENDYNEVDNNNSNAESSDSDFENNNNNAEGSVTSNSDLESKCEGFGCNISDYARVNNADEANERGASNSRLKFSTDDRSKIRFKE